MYSDYPVSALWRLNDILSCNHEIILLSKGEKDKFAIIVGFGVVDS